MAKTPTATGTSPVRIIPTRKLTTCTRSSGQGGPDDAQGGERGLGGALAGGVAGGYAGHKADHGILGTIGGAIMGHLTEDAVKKHRNKDKDEHQGYGQSGYGQQGYGQSGYGQGYPPSHHGSSGSSGGGMMDQLGNFLKK